MTELEHGQLAAVHRMITVVNRTVLAAYVFGILLFCGFAYNIIRTEIAIEDIRRQTSAIADIKLSRAADIALEAERNCTYTREFVAVFHAWALGLDSAERNAASKSGATPAERTWHEARIGTYSKLFASLDTLGSAACAKLTK